MTEAKSTIDAPDWSTIPAPVDDGATRHLLGAQMAVVPLHATDGRQVDLAALRGRIPALGNRASIIRPAGT
jgi:hypothetical protein